MLNIYTSANCASEKKYIFDQILGRFLGVSFQVHYSEMSGSIKVSMEGRAGELEINDVFFFQFENKARWLSQESLPLLPFKISERRNIPILYGNDKIDESRESFHIGIDLFGSCFFMLSRYEELVVNEKDIHGRFPARASVAYKGGFLDRPIVDEYIEVLWFYMKKLWPSLERKALKPNYFVSCDVDFIQDRGVRFPGIINRLGGDLIKRKSFKQFLGSLKLFYTVSILKNKTQDPFNTFNFMMDVCESNNLKMAFYFIPRNNKLPIDGDYDIESDEILELMRNIIARGHEVGYHASYYSYSDLEVTRKEVALLRKVFKKAGGNPEDIKGGRQHYLRWETGITEKNWETVGLEYDSTLGFAETVGFRCGTGQEYNFYDSHERKPMKLRIRPLLAMEVSAFNLNYMGLSHEEAFLIIEKTKNTTEKYHHDFTLLWHNSSFNLKKDFELYQKLLFLKGAPNIDAS